jgi:hypothetical protein
VGGGGGVGGGVRAGECGRGSEGWGVGLASELVSE